MSQRAASSVGRARRSQCRGRGFEPLAVHHPLQLNIVHISSSLSRHSGGVGPVVLQFAEYQQHAGCDVCIGCRLDRHTFQDLPSDRQYRVIAEPPSRFALPGASRRLNKRMAGLVPETDILHCHALWESCLWSAASFARKHNRPYVVSTHGMLNPLSLLQSKTKKKIARFLGVENYLSSAACLHATSQLEAENIRKLGTRNPIAVVAIGLDLTEYGPVHAPSLVEKAWPHLKQKKILFVLSRIHPQKGLLHLVRAWGSLSRQYGDWHLVIAGPDHNGHEAELQAAAKQAGASGHTTFTGPVYGALKKELFAACDLFVLPTFSENFGIVIAESLASGKPVITTKGTPWRELETCGCGWWIDIGQDPLERAIRQALDLSDDTRVEMGARGRELIEKSYSWPKIAAEMVDVYRWLAGQGDRPDCVRVDGI